MIRFPHVSSAHGLAMVCLIILCAALCWTVPVRSQSLRLSGPPVADSLPLVHMAGGGSSLEDMASDIRLIPWFSPDQMRAMIAGAQTDVVIATISTLATLHAKGLNVRIAALAVPPGWIVSSIPPVAGENPGLDRLRDQTVLLPFGPGEMPGIIFRTLARQSGLNPEKDLRLRYTGGAMEAVQLLLLGEADHAYLSEPAATLAIMRSRKTNTPLCKAIDINKAWGRAFPDTPQLVTAIGVVGELARNATAVAAIGRAYSQGYRWVQAHPVLACQQAEKLYPALAAQMSRLDNFAITPSLVEYNTGKRSAIFLLQRMLEANPASVGGRMPDDSFWIPVP